MGRRPTQENKNGVRSASSLPISPPSPLSSRAKPRDLQFSSPATNLSWKHHPLLCHLGVIMGLRPTYEDENGFYSATSLPGTTTLSFVISTGAQRSGEISVWIPLLGNVFRRSVRLAC